MKRRNVFKVLGISALSLIGLGADKVTSPVAHGFPDWARQSGASDISVLNSVGLSIAGSQSFGPFFVGNMPYLYVQAFPNDRCQITLDWYGDAAQSQQMNNDVLASPQGGDIIQCVPARGPFVLVTVDVSVNPSVVSTRIFMTPMPFAASGGAGGSNTLLSVNLSPQAPATTVNWDTVSTRGGWVYWNADLEGATAWRFKLLAIDFNGGITMLDFVTNGTRQGGRMVLAPALPLRIESTNGGPGAHDFYGVITHHPFYP